MDRFICHIDLNHCYAQIEEMKFPELREVPMAVGGHEESRHGIILAKNDLAKKFKIKTGESLRDAYKKCPDLVIIHPNYDDYMYYTEMVKDIYRKYTERVEPYGLDEAWIDLTDSYHLFADSAEILARRIQQEVYETVGLTTSIGFSYNKIFAKLGSDMDKHMGFTAITPENFKDLVWPLPVEDLFYVGRATQRKLNELGIYTIGQLAEIPFRQVRKRLRCLGKMGDMIWCFANGYDVDQVALTSACRDVKSVGNSVTAIHDLHNSEEARLVLIVLAESVASRMRDLGMKGSVISLSVRDTDLHYRSCQHKIDRATCLSTEILDVAMQLLRENVFFELPLRGIGISVSKLVPDDGNVQLNFFIDEEQKKEEKDLEITIDAIRDKFGHAIIKKAITLKDRELTDFNPKGDHVIHPQSYF